jgi:hypothetical protein
VGNAEQQKDSPGCRDSKASLGNMHSQRSISEAREKERSMSGGKLYPWVEEEYPAMVRSCNPTLAEAIKQREMAEIYEAQAAAR